jgi:hypothetical protein
MGKIGIDMGPDWRGEAPAYIYADFFHPGHFTLKRRQHGCMKFGVLP